MTKPSKFLQYASAGIYILNVVLLRVFVRQLYLT